MIRDDVGQKELREHVLNHVTYPATKQEIIDQCNKMSHVPDSARQMVENLPDRRYNSSDEVMRALKM